MSDVPLSCPDSGLAVMRALSGTASRTRIPLSGELELTKRCNLRCVHCYVPLCDRRGAADAPGMPTARWLRLLDEVADVGCLFLLLSGGEPLLHPDFAAIYRRAREKGMLPALFSNGTLIDEEVVALLKDLPPRGVEITLYGATAETYEGITGVPGSYARCRRGIDMLLENGIATRLKTILMQPNQHEFHDMEQIARAHGVRFRMDAMVTPRFDGDDAPLNLRVPAEEAVALDFSDEKRAEAWEEYRERVEPVGRLESLYSCGAARTGFHVGAEGFLKPCLMCADVRYDLKMGTFLEGWEQELPRVWDRKPDKDWPCVTCEDRALCGFCPPLVDLEGVRPDRADSYMCALGRYRRTALQGRCQCQGEHNDEE